MKLFLIQRSIFFLLLTGGIAGHLQAADHVERSSRPRQVVDFNHGWRFLRADQNDAFEVESDDQHWQHVTLPHTARVEPLVVVDLWQGTCWYRKPFSIPKKFQGKKIFVEFEASMQVADVWINGQHKTTHHGGYLPFSIDITDEVRLSAENLLAVKLVSQDDPDVPPGKPRESIDFCLYGGLYRNVRLLVVDRLHVTDPVYAAKQASGGVFVTCSQLSDDSATVQIKTHLLNERDAETSLRVEQRLIDPGGHLAGRVVSESATISAGDEQTLEQVVEIKQPRAWHPHHPHLYTLKTIVSDQNGPVDAIETRVGLRRISFSAKEGFVINGERMFLRGTNRHQEYPYLGYALSDNAQYRDARKIKEAGFDYIRLSHYPPAPAFLDACDELGLVVMDCIPGWQFMGGETFRQRALQDCRDMIRRDRNHPCVVLWEVSLNEAKQMDEAFVAAAHEIAHAEYPGDQCFTAGWVDIHYDVFGQARQHGGCHDYDHGDKACVVSEYGDWEYYAQNAGLDQPGFRDLLQEERNSRQLRRAGEKRLLQQAMNFQEAHNDNLSTLAVGDSLWVMFDYNRGYEDSIESSGPMDIFRLPKFSYYFFRSQRDPDVDQSAANRPMVHIANYWTPESPTTVRVFSNCEEVALSLNGQLVEQRRPDRDAFSNRLAHPPFHFDIESFEPGELRAVGLIQGQKVARHEVRTPGNPVGLALCVDRSGRPLAADGADAVFVYAAVVDEHGTTLPADQRPIKFEISGPARLIGKNPIPAEAGVATILVVGGAQPGKITLTASAEGLEPARIQINSYSAGSTDSRSE